MVVSIQRIRENAVIPTRGSQSAAGYDLSAAIDGEVSIKPDETVLIPTGLKIAIPEGYFGGIFARSGLATKEGLRPANCVGVIDADYRGELLVSLHNDSKVIRAVTPGERIAQLVILPFLAVSFSEQDELDGTVRGEAGFGSTGLD